MPAVSVIMPGYNVAAYIGDAIDSVLAQTHTDLELIVVDDGSSDGTGEVAEKRARRDPRVRVIHRGNGGIASARNEAMRRAAAPLFAIVDSDDLLEPEYLALQLAILRARPEVDVVTGNAWFLGGPADGQPARPWPDARPDPDLPAIIADETAVFIMTVFRRHVFEVTGGFNESLRTNEDYDFWLRAALAGFRFARNDRPLGHYRRRDDSLSADDVRMVRGLLQVYGMLRPTLADRPRERALLEAQVARFETVLHEVEARDAIARGDFRALEMHLAALYARRGGAALKLAHLASRWAPALLCRAYEWRRARRTPPRSARPSLEPVKTA